MKPFKKTSNPAQIAKKHKVSLETILKQLKMGKNVEKEHTTKENVAKIIALHHLGELPDYYSRLKKVETMKEDLRNWFNPKHPDGGWKRINSKGEAIGPCARGKGEGKPKCMSNKKRSQLSQKERAAAVAAKRRHDPVADRKGKGGKPVNVSNFGKGRISEAVQALFEKNKPTDPGKWSACKSQAKKKFDVYPSAYANGWAAKCYKKKGGGWRTVKESIIQEMAQRRDETGEQYSKRLLDKVLQDQIADMDIHDRIHGAIAYAKHLSTEYGRSIPLIGRMKLKGSEQHAQGMRITGIDRRGKMLIGHPVGAGGRAAHHNTEVQNPVSGMTGLHLGRYSDIKPEHSDRLRRLMNLRGINMREEIIKNMVKMIVEEKKSKKPYKGFKKGKNHPEGGLSRAEAKRQGIHAGIETKREAQKKGGFGKLSGKTQKRRKSFCGRMCGMKRKRTSSKTARDPKSKINAALRVWGCRCEQTECHECDQMVEQMGIGGGFTTGQVGTPNPNLAGMDSILPTPTTKHKVTKAMGYIRRRKLAENIAFRNVLEDLAPRENSDTNLPPEEVQRSFDRIMSNQYAYLRRRYGSSVHNVMRQLAIQDARRRLNSQEKPKRVDEEVVNSSNAGTMTKGEIRKRDKTAKKVKARPIKGDTEEESRHRIATFITLRARGRKKNK